MDLLEHAVAVTIALAALLTFALMIWAGQHQS
jgi:hypothetical protein